MADLPRTSESGKTDRESELLGLVTEYEAWLGAALEALGAKTVFDIPNWRENLDKSAVLLEQEQREARAAMEAVRA